MSEGKRQNSFPVRFHSLPFARSSQILALYLDFYATLDKNKHCSIEKTAKLSLFAKLLGSSKPEARSNCPKPLISTTDITARSWSHVRRRKNGALTFSATLPTFSPRKRLKLKQMTNFCVKIGKYLGSSACKSSSGHTGMRYCQYCKNSKEKIKLRMGILWLRF